jgi:hypothetical protein
MPVGAGQLRRNERTGPTLEDEDAGVNRRSRVECAPWQPACDGSQVPRSPDDVVEGAGPWQRALHRHAPLDEQVGAPERDARVVEQVAENRVGPVERKVRDDAERLAGERQARSVVTDDFDVGPAPAQVRGQAGIELDRHYATCHARELRGQPAAARPEIEDEVVRTDSGVANELRRQRL